MRLGYAIEIDATPLQESISADSLLDGCDLSNVTEAVMQRFRDTLDGGRAFAKITSRPGQVGNCDGVLFEGAHLTKLLEGLSLIETGDLDPKRKVYA